MSFPDENENMTPNENPTPEENTVQQEDNQYIEPRQTYSINEDEQAHLWSEPKYESSDVQSADVYSPSVNIHTESSEDKPRKKKKHGFLKGLCLVILCVVLSGATCYFIVDYKLSNQGTATIVNTNQVVLGASDNQVTADVVNADDSAANQIYNMACDYQVVGVNTSVNTTNIFGQQTSYPVSGTGFVISQDGYIMTNYHVIAYAAIYGYDMTVMFNDGTSVSADVVGYLEDNDVAIIKIDPANLKLNPVVLGDSNDLSAGDIVYAVGNPLGELTYSITDGIVSSLDRVITTTDSITGSATSMNMFQITAAVNPGNSGGPVYNADGEVIGIVTAKYSDSGVEGLGFAIPINDAVGIATQLIEKGYVAGASLGITCSSIEQVYSSFTIQYCNFPYGLVVMSVNPGSAAENAGLKKGDIITALNGTEVTTLEEMKLILRRLSPGDEGTITIYRLSSSLGTGEYIDLSIIFDEAAATSSQSETQESSGSSKGEDSSDSKDSGQSSGGFSPFFPFFGN